MEAGGVGEGVVVRGHVLPLCASVCLSVRRATITRAAGNDRLIKVTFLFTTLNTAFVSHFGIHLHLTVSFFVDEMLEEMLMILHKFC